MALFGSTHKTKSSSSKTLQPIVVRTDNVAKEIMKISKSYDITPSQLDFNILSVQTYTRIYDGSKETEWEEIPQKRLHELDDETALLNPHFEIKQTYEIEIFNATAEEYNPFPELKVAVGANATKCKVYLSIGAGSVIDSMMSFSEEFHLLINKKKVRAGILIYMFDEVVKGVVSKISAQVKVQERLEYKKSKTLLIAEGIEPTATLNDALILHFEKKKEVDENDKIDYASRGFIQSVYKDELLIEYIKPKRGTAGRDCRGRFLEPAEPLVKHEPTFNIDSTIRMEESETSIEYRANENGYIAFRENTYFIKKDMELDEISFKKTGSIKSGIDSDVILNVKEDDLVKDAIGSGMDVEVTEIEIEGNVGSNANVKAHKAAVGGLVHKSAVVTADDLNINVHKGKAFGDKVVITRLEHGEVDAKRAEISQAIGGEIYASEIKISICASHVKATASKVIEIGKLQGSENIFIIDPLLSRETQVALEENEAKVKALATEVRDLEKEIERGKKFIQEERDAFFEIKKRLLYYKKNGVKLPASFVKKYKQFTQVQETLKENLKIFEVKNNKLSLMNTERPSLQNSIFDARVINRDRWVGYNEIKFKLVDPQIELVYKPAEGSSEKIFAVVEKAEDEFVIEAVDE